MRSWERIKVRGNPPLADHSIFVIKESFFNQCFPEAAHAQIFVIGFMTTQPHFRGIRSFGIRIRFPSGLSLGAPVDGISPPVPCWNLSIEHAY